MVVAKHVTMQRKLFTSGGNGGAEFEQNSIFFFWTDVKWWYSVIECSHIARLDRTIMGERKEFMSRDSKMNEWLGK